MTMEIINWLETFEQEWNEIQPFKTIFNPIGDAMDTFIFKGKSTTRIKADNYIQACGKLVDRLVEYKKVEIELNDTYSFIDNLNNELIPYYLATEAREKNHACSLYVKSLCDRGILITADKE